MFTKIEHANDENEQKDEAAFIFKPVSVEACRCGGGKALSTASFPQKHGKNPRQVVPMSIISAGTLPSLWSVRMNSLGTMRSNLCSITRKLWLFSGYVFSGKSQEAPGGARGR